LRQNFSAQIMGANGVGKGVGIVLKNEREVIRMKITLIRHGKVNMKWKKWYTSEQFDRDCAKYDSSPICPIDDKQEGLWGEIYISTLQRSFHTAERLFGECEFTETELLNEVPLRSFCDSKISLPLWMWNVGGRLQWMMQSRRQPERKADTQKRAGQLVEKLIEQNKDCILVSHGFFMRTLLAELKRQGFCISKSGVGIANLAQITAVKSIKGETANYL